MKIQPHETELVGSWVVKNNQTVRDVVCERVEWLTARHLKKIAVSERWGAWETLFQDPDDGRFWEQTYPQGGLHGGGPPTLKCLSKDEAKAKYGDKVP